MGAYTPPTGSTDPNAPYSGKNTAAGLQGSRVPRYAVEMPQREIHNAIAALGLPPTNTDMTQLTQAIRAAVAAGARVFYGVDAGTTANTLTIPETSPTLTAITDGTVFILVPGATNTGVDVTAQLAGKGTLTVLTRAGAKPAAGDLVAGMPVAFIAYAGTLRFHGLARSEIGAAAAVAPEVKALTPAGARYASAFIAGIALNGFPGGSAGTAGLPSPYSVALQLTVSGCTYIDAQGVVGFRQSDTGGSDCRARLIATGGGLAQMKVGDYLGCRTTNFNQIPTPVGMVLQNLDPAQAVTLQLIVDRSETTGTVVVYDPRILIQHNGNP